MGKVHVATRAPALRASKIPRRNARVADCPHVPPVQPMPRWMFGVTALCGRAGRSSWVVTCNFCVRPDPQGRRGPWARRRPWGFTAPPMRSLSSIGGRRSPCGRSSPWIVEAHGAATSPRAVATGDASSRRSVWDTNSCTIGSYTMAMLVSFVTIDGRARKPIGDPFK